MNWSELGFNSLMQRTLLGPSNNLIQNKGNPSGLGLIINPATDIVFSSTDYDTAAWTAGTIYFSDGSRSGQVAAGNTGNMTDVTFIYFDRNKAGELHYTTDHTSAVGSSRIIVAIAEQGAIGKNCKIIPMIGSGLIVSGITVNQINFTPVESDEVIASINASTEGITIEADNIAISGTTTFTSGYNPTSYSKNFVSTLVWTATDIDTASWASGSIIRSDGTTYSISDGNTGNILSLTYVYLDPAVSVTVLQTATIAATAAGTGKSLIAVVQAGAVGAKCIIDVIGSNGTTIDGDRITTGKIQSADGKTYFDLDGNQIIINDGSNNRIVIGTI